MSLILVGGALANKPGNGGAAWTRLSWIRGLARLGHDVYFVEEIDPATCRTADGAPAALDASANAAFFTEVVSRFGLAERSSLLATNGVGGVGLARADIARLAADADLLVNISGHLTLAGVKDRCRRRVFIDLDPGYTQFWSAQGLAAGRLAGHDAYYSVGENIGTPSCAIPTSGIAWRPIRQPVVLEDWPAAGTGSLPAFTTVASWRGAYGRVCHDGRHYGLKAHEFRKFAALPAASPWPLDIALEADAADGDDVARLKTHGWSVSDPRAVAQPASFRDYVQQSAAEFSVAQGIYVETHSGWFSDRTVRYLASGKPALVQDTGFPRHYAESGGVVPFRTFAEAVDGARSIARDYDAHAAAARSVAERWFAADRVLGPMLDDQL